MAFRIQKNTISHHKRTSFADLTKTNENRNKKPTTSNKL